MHKVTSLPLRSSHTLVRWLHYTPRKSKKKEVWPKIRVVFRDFCGLTNSLPKICVEFCIVLPLCCTPRKYNACKKSMTCPLQKYSNVQDLCFVKKNALCTFRVQRAQKGSLKRRSVQIRWFRARCRCRRPRSAGLRSQQQGSWRRQHRPHWSRCGPYLQCWKWAKAG